VIVQAEVIGDDDEEVWPFGHWNGWRREGSVNMGSDRVLFYRCWFVMGCSNDVIAESQWGFLTNNGSYDKEWSDGDL